MDILLDSHTWVTLSFFVFAGIGYKYGLPSINAKLDKRIAEIKNELETSERLRIEAQEMLAQYQRKHKDSMKEADAIVKRAKDSAKKIKENAEADLNESIARKEQQLAQRLAQMEENAINHIRSHAADLAMKAAAQIVAQKLDKKTGIKLLEDSIEGVRANIH